METKIGKWLCVAAMFAAMGASALTPTEPVGNLQGFSPDECSIGLWVKFDGGLFAGKSTEGSPTGLFGLRLDDEGRAVVTFRALPTEILGDVVMTGRDTIGKGDWHHYEISVSKSTKVLRFYIDGRFQWENDCLVMHRLRTFAETERAPTADFRGEVKGLAVWAAGLESEAILPAGGPETDPTDTVAKRRHAAKLSANLAALSSVKAPLALYAVPASSNEPYLPCELPTIGTLTNVATLVTAPGEQESLSFVAFAMKPLAVNAVRVGDLVGKAGRIPAKSVDTKLVKRWYRTGGSWVYYHSDRRERQLTPDLLVNDDRLIEVDEFRRANRIRLAYPEGVRYVDVSDPEKTHLDWGGSGCAPFEDAKTLQPVEIREAGRNQQFYFTLDVPKDARPGLYEGSVTFETTAGAVPAKFVVRVLDVELPVVASPLGQLDRIYATHMNHYPLRNLVSLSPTLPERRELARSILHSMKTHHMMHVTDMFDTDTLVKWGREEGMIPDHVHGGPYENPVSWKKFYPGVKDSELTLADREAGIRASMRGKLEAREWFERSFPHASRQVSIYVSESSWYQAQHWNQEEMGEPARRLGHDILAHGSSRNTAWAADVEDVHAHHGKPAAEAAVWRHVGGEMLNYADPFPGPENPMIFRYQVGWEMYRSGLGGEMMHGWLNCRTPFNEWAEDYGGDGNYRHFAMVFPQRHGVIYSLAWDGMREALSDLRWLTRLEQLADAYRDSDDFDLKTEAKRQIRWVEGLPVLGSDAEMIRAGVQRRILVMQDAIRRRGRKLPPVDRAYAKYRWGAGEEIR